MKNLFEHQVIELKTEEKKLFEIFNFKMEIELRNEMKKDARIEICYRKD